MSQAFKGKFLASSADVESLEQQTGIPAPPTPTPGSGSKQEINRLAVCEFYLKLITEFVKLADRKAQFLLRIALAVFGATFIGLPPSMMVLKQYLVAGGHYLWAFGLVVILYAICITCLMVSIVKVVSVIRPRLLIDGRQSDMFFESIAKLDLDDFLQSMEEMDSEDALHEAATQVYHNAVVAHHKYSKLNGAVAWMLGGGIFGIVFALLVIVTVGLLPD